MQLSLNTAQRREYMRLISGPHDFQIEVDVLTMEEHHISTIKRRPRDDGHLGLVDGQINLQRAGVIKRTATMTFFNPDHALHLDSESPFAGAVFADRLIRVRHIVELANGHEVHVAAFVGGIATVSRDGADLTIECQDKTMLATSGTRPYTVKKGRNAVGAIRAIMEDCTGEKRFRFPQGTSARLKRSYNVGWKDEASPWAVCQRIADSLGLQLVYACDGALLLRRRPRTPVLTIAEGGLLTGLPKVKYDVTTVKNIVRVTGQTKGTKKTKTTEAHKPVKFTEVAAPRASHPLAANNPSFSRHGVPRYLPLLVDDSSLHKRSSAHARAVRELRNNLPMSVSYAAEGVPVYHLDYADPIRIRTDFGDAIVPFVEASIPIGLEGDASYGAQKVVSRPRKA